MSDVAARTKQISLNAFSDALAAFDASVLDRPLMVDVLDGPGLLPVQVKATPAAGCEGAALVFCFHGAIDREKRVVPVFEGGYLLPALQDRAWILSIADPLLSMHPDLRTTWYCGSEGHDVPRAIQILASRLCNHLSPERTVFVATSTGGHAALRQSRLLPGSHAVVSNPISRISAYYKGHVTDYRKTCWPSLGDGVDWPDGFVDNLAPLYADGFTHDVVYLNNARDHHFWLQAVPFLNEIRRGPAKDRLLFVSSYYPQHAGHSTPPQVLSRWVQAVCSAPQRSLESIAETAAKLESGEKATKQGKVVVTQGRTIGASGPSAADLAIARGLLDSLN